MHSMVQSSADGSGVPIGAVIGGRVRQRRAERAWTLDELAARSGVSKRMLINIEQGSANPSIATLLRISDALGVGLPALVDAGRSPRMQVTRGGSAPVLWTGPSGGTAALVAGTGPPDIAELWDWRLAPGEVHESEPHTSGTRKLLLVLEGTIELKAGQDTQRLAAGDSASFRSDVADSYGNPASPGPHAPTARFAVAVFEPQVGPGVKS
jgi:transcriptional regulator with XRE-family HTH domain